MTRTRLSPTPPSRWLSNRRLANQRSSLLLSVHPAVPSRRRPATMRCASAVSPGDCDSDRLIPSRTRRKSVNDSPRPGADSRAAPRGSRRRQWRRGCTVVERARRSRCGGQRRREVVVEGGIGGHGSRLRGRSTSLTAAVSRRLSPSSSVMPSVLRGCVRAPPRAPRAGRGVRPPAAGADAVRGPRFGVRFTGAGASRCGADANLGSQPAARSRRLDRGVAADA